MERNFAEPNDVRPQATSTSAAGAGEFNPQIIKALNNFARTDTSGFEQFPMHMKEALRSTALMQIVHVLGNQEKVPCPFSFQACQGEMCGIRRYFARKQLLSPLIIELVNQRGLPLKRLGRGDFLQPVCAPEAPGVPKGGDP
jgi:hypothetical protein